MALSRLNDGVHLSCIEDEQTQTHHAGNRTGTSKVEGNLGFGTLTSNNRSDQRNAETDTDGTDPEDDCPDAVCESAEGKFGRFVAGCLG